MPARISTDRSVDIEAFTVNNTEENILIIARKLIASQGFSATSMRQVAEEAGIGKATIYHHFKDKNALFMAMLEKAGSELRFSPSDLAEETDPRKRLRKATLACLEFLSGMMDLMHIARREVPEARARLQSENGRVFRELSLFLADSIQQGIDQKIFRSLPPKQAAQTLFAMIQGTYAMSYLSGAQLVSPERTADAILDIYFLGLDAR
jgi:AcrR family transcriptional regulator